MTPHSEGFIEAKHPRNIVTKPPRIAPLTFSTIFFHRWLCLKLHNLCLGKKDFCFLPYPTNLRHRPRGLVLLTSKTAPASGSVYKVQGQTRTCLTRVGLSTFLSLFKLTNPKLEGDPIAAHERP